MVFGSPRPVLQRAILNSLLQRSDGEIWAPCISAPTLRSILMEAFQQHVTPLAADVPAMGGPLAAELRHLTATSTAISASTAAIKAQLLDLDQRLQATATALESLHDTAGLTAQAVKDIAAQPAPAAWPGRRCSLDPPHGRTSLSSTPPPPPPSRHNSSNKPSMTFARKPTSPGAATMSSSSTSTSRQVRPPRAFLRHLSATFLPGPCNSLVSCGCRLSASPARGGRLARHPCSSP
eukprot:jgi/Mesvir1/18996/Mv25788-RA.1